ALSNAPRCFFSALACFVSCYYIGRNDARQPPLFGNMIFFYPYVCLEQFPSGALHFGPLITRPDNLK
ncbi:MAG: hypothetical protein ACOX8W_09380, partial [bacterium]